jgi:hypothetical protein
MYHNPRNSAGTWVNESFVTRRKAGIRFVFGQRKKFYDRPNFCTCAGQERACGFLEKVILWQLATKGLYCFPEDGAAEFFPKDTQSISHCFARTQR